MHSQSTTVISLLLPNSHWKDLSPGRLPVRGRVLCRTRVCDRRFRKLEILASVLMRGPLLSTPAESRLCMSSSAEKQLSSCCEQHFRGQTALVSGSSLPGDQMGLSVYRWVTPCPWNDTRKCSRWTAPRVLEDGAHGTAFPVVHVICSFKNLPAFYFENVHTC